MGDLRKNVFQVELTPAESLKLGLFAREAGMGDQVFTLPESIEGYPMPEMSFQIGSDAIDRYIDDFTELLQGEGGSGFGG